MKELNNLTSNTLSIGQKLLLKDDIDINNNEVLDTYVVQKGDTLYGIANKFNTTVDYIKRINNLASNTLSIGQILLINDTIEVPDNSDSNYDFYTIKKGDTLYSLSKKFGVTVDYLKELNNLNTNTLSIGSTIKIPKSNNTYIVKKGDTLYSIAQNNNTTVNIIKELNDLNTNVLSIGQELILR